jgi:hypothetical protein
MPEKSKLSTVDQVLVVPPSGRHGQKRLHATTRRSNSVPLADQVMTQVELPPYCRPRSPLDSIAIEIIFGRIFKAFQRISQVAATSVASTDDNKPLKRFRQPPLKKVMVARYSYIFCLHLQTC